MTVLQKPLQYAYRGTQTCNGLLFDSSLLTDLQLQSRVIQLWDAQASLHKIDSYYILLWPHDRIFDTDGAPGFPIVTNGKLLSTAPLSDNFLQEVKAEPSSLWHLKNAQYIHLTLQDDNKVDPSIWLDISTLELSSFESLGVVPKPPKVINPVSEKQSNRLFSRLNLSPSDQQRSFINELKGHKREAGTSQASGVPAGANPPQVYGNRPHAGKSTRRGLFKKKNGHKHSILAPQGAKPPLLQPLISRLAQLTGIAGLQNRKQAKYLRKMAEMFESGDLEEALKHAIPMSDIRDAAIQKHPALANFSRRTSLKLQTQRQSSTSASFVDENSTNYLHQLYEKAFEQLDQTGKVKEAAFVLSELLRSYERAVDYLEQHGEYELAAELAEGQRLNPEKIIKQWVLANNVDRAVYIASLTGCFRAAINLLEQKHPKTARDLSAKFARTNASAGYYKDAVELALKSDIEATEIRQWIEKVLKADEPDAPAMLIHFMSHSEKNQTKEDNQWLMESLRDRSFERISHRESIYMALMTYGQSIGMQPITRLALRSYVDDVSRGLITLESSQLNRLISKANDPLLQHEIKATGLHNKKNMKDNARALKDQLSPKTYTFTSQAPGHITDLCLLNPGLILIANGDAGVDVLKPDGRRLARLAITCHQIIKSDSGQFALFISKYDTHIVVSKFEAATKKVTRWSELALTCWSESFDGYYWLVANEDAVWALNIEGNGEDAVWEIKDLPGTVKAITRDSKGFALACANHANGLIETWRYESKSMLLREREYLDKNTLIDEHPLDLDADATILLLSGNYWYLGKGESKGTQSKINEGTRVERGKILGNWVALESSQEGNVSQLALYDRQSTRHGTARLLCNYNGHRAYFDLTADILAFATDAGEVACIDLSTGVLLTRFSL